MAEVVTDEKRQGWRQHALEREWTYLQKGALIMEHLMQGEGLRTCDVADLMGVKHWLSADRAMTLLQDVEPAIQRDEEMVWYIDFTQMSS